MEIIIGIVCAVVVFGAGVLVGRKNPAKANILAADVAAGAAKVDAKIQGQ